MPPRRSPHPHFPTDAPADDAEDFDGPSKSQKKRDAEALQAIGKELVELSKERLNKMDLPEPLLVAVLEAQRINSHGAIRRQMQLIGKLMRDVDADPIVEHLAALRGESNAAKAVFHALENWRDRLLADDSAVTAWLAEYPHTDAQPLRQLIRNARKEALEHKPPKSSRALFRLLRDIQGG